ncbi:hypothetical protein [Micromonospora sp. NPDC005710]|uniref:hypothetical protein n=1 Tax=Micromonospora sp. NPDC005710 TaxID=3157051 RepID=UPI0033EF7662
MEIAGVVLGVVGSLVAGREALHSRSGARNALVAAKQFEAVLDAALLEAADAAVREPRASIDQRVDRLAGALRESDELIQELQGELRTRKAAIDRLRAEEEQSRQLAALSAEEAAAVRALLDNTIASAHADLQGRLLDEQRELRDKLASVQQQLDIARKKGRREQLLYFVSGALVSIPIGFMVNLFS